jgi:dCTP deaminase
MSAFEFGGNGVFPIQWLWRAAEDGLIRAERPIPKENFQPASVDLRLGATAHRLRCSFLPGARRVEERLPDLLMGDVDLQGDGGVLEKNRPYLIPLVEELALPAHVRAKTNPKSSTGRLDVFTRVITDRGISFDEIRPGYRGRLWLEVIPLSFTVRVRAGLSLNQLRLFVGQSQCSDQDIERLHRDTPILFRDGRALEAIRISNGGVFLSLDLAGGRDGQVGFRAKRNAQLVDMHRKDHEPAEFWEPARREREGLVLVPEEFYLLMSAEAVRIPPDHAAEMTAYDPTAGELRTHYAGFFDPGFGHSEERGFIGSRAALEVRAHDVPFLIEGGQYVCKLEFERMAEAPEVLYGWEIGSSYQDQDVTLGKHFKRPGSPLYEARQPKLPPMSATQDESSEGESDLRPGLASGSPGSPTRT